MLGPKLTEADMNATLTRTPATDGDYTVAVDGRPIGSIVLTDDDREDRAPFRWEHPRSRRSGDAWSTDFAVNQILAAEAGKPALRP